MKKHDRFNRSDINGGCSNRLLEGPKRLAQRSRYKVSMKRSIVKRGILNGF